MRLLDDDLMSRFLAEGYLVLRPPELAPDFHQGIFEAARDLYDEGLRVGGDTVHLQYFGDNVVARMPHLARLLESPTMVGALTSILGEGYVLHPHHFVHTATHRDQGYHQDGNLPWNERGHYRSHRPNWAMLFYYPQDVTLENGPTEVLPGSQYWTRDFERGQRWHPGDRVDRTFNEEVSNHGDLGYRDRRLAESLASLGIEGLTPRRLPVPAGSVVLAHYDLMHRGVRQHPDFEGRRYMYKFYFLRTREPTRPTWENRSDRPTGPFPFPSTRPIVERSWAWLRGTTLEPATQPSLRNEALANAPAEDTRMEAAYALGARAAADDDALDALARGLTHERECVRRASGYGLGATGERGLDILCAATGHADARVRRVAVFGIGETRSTRDRAIDALVERLADADDLVRSNAAYALGNLARCRALPDSAIDSLIDRLDPVVEPDNSTNVNMTRSTVRESVAYALLQLAANGRLSERQRQRFAEAGCADHDRYVRGLTVKALVHPGAGDSPAWMRPLLAALDRAHFLPDPRDMDTSGG